jgi:hypothetical protein
MYYLKYYGVTDFCGAKDSIFLDIRQSPWVDLGKDIILCEGTNIELAPQANPDIINFVWQDRSTLPKYTVATPGEYFVEVSNMMERMMYLSLWYLEFQILMSLLSITAGGKLFFIQRTSGEGGMEK